MCRVPYVVRFVAGDKAEQETTLPINVSTYNSIRFHCVIELGCQEKYNVFSRAPGTS